jgi:hypothetical protein
MMHGHSPVEMPYVLLMKWYEDSLEQYVEHQIDIQQRAVEKALSNFWNEING